MEFRRDDRGVTVQIGAVLLFGILIIALATLQVTVVPDENEATEFEHSLDVQESVGELRNALLAAARSGDPAATSIPLGTTYEQRTFFVNPPPASGTIRTVGTGEAWANVSLANARADSEYENANEYWDGTTRTYDTGSIVYTPSYTRYKEAPTTVYENSLVANVFSEDRTLERTGQTLIRGNRINLLTINGTLQENGVTSQSVDARPLSTYTNTVTVTSTASDPLWINITSRLSADTWRDRVLAEQTTSNGGNVAEVAAIGNTTRGDVTYHRIGIRLAAGTYELRGSSVAVGAVAEQNKQPKPTYLVVTDGYDTVGNGSTGTLTVQVRDQFNNPVEDFAVNGSLDTEFLQFVDENGNEVDTITQTTGENGYATFTYTGVKTTGADTTWLNVSMLGGGESYEHANFTDQEVPVFSESGASGDGGGAKINPGSAGDIILENSTLNQPNGDYIVVEFNNTKTIPANLSFARIGFYYTSDTQNLAYEEVALGNVSTASNFPATPAAVMQIGRSYADVNPRITLNPGRTTITLQFRPTAADSINKNDFVVVTFVFEVDGEYERYRYFVSPGQ